jgi:hypothetical protein
MTTAALVCAGAIATAGVATGVAYAANINSTITVCVHHNGGGLYRASSCAAGDGQLTWNVQGPRGPRGLPGPQGSPGPQGPAGLSLFARVDNTGVLHQHSAGVSESKDSTFTGLYHVFFTQDISNCAATVSQGETSNNGFFPGTFYEAVVQSDPNNDGNPHEINVYPTDSSGTPKDAGFDLIVAC